MKDVRAKCLNGLLLMASLLIAYVAMEVGYRLYLYCTLKDQLYSALYKASASDGGNPAEFDMNTGFRYAPGKIWKNTGGNQKNFWRINEYGMIANDIDETQYAIEKPNNEYRIALLGDSFTASNPGYLRWADLLQDALNRSPEWREYVKGKYTRVLNFGLDGTGLVQWAAVYKYRAQSFSPDLVIATFITDDIRRRFVYRGSQDFKNESDKRAAIERFTESSITRMPWRNWPPELIAQTVGKYVGMAPQLTLAAAVSASETRFYGDQGEAIRASLASMHEVRCLNENFILMQISLLEELIAPVDDSKRWPTTPGIIGLEGSFIKAAKEKGMDVINLWHQHELPKDRGALQGLYNLPIDSHLSDYGVAIYADWLEQYLINWSKLNHNKDKQTPRSCPA